MENIEITNFHFLNLLNNFFGEDKNQNKIVQTVWGIWHARPPPPMSTPLNKYATQFFDVKCSGVLTLVDGIFLKVYVTVLRVFLLNHNSSETSRTAVFTDRESNILQKNVYFLLGMGGVRKYILPHTKKGCCMPPVKHVTA